MGKFVVRVLLSKWLRIASHAESLRIVDLELDGIDSGVRRALNNEQRHREASVVTRANFSDDVWVGAE
jgi:hypothetical protein